MLFKGTESTPFDCDEFTGAADLPVGVVGTRDYLALQGLIEPHNTSMAWVTTTESPLRSSEPFLLSYRLLQVLSLLFYSYNVWYAVKQLRAFGVLSKEWRRELFLSKEERDPAAKDKGPAVPVISLNLVRPPTPRAPLYYSALPATQPHHTTFPPSPPSPLSPPSSPPRLLTFAPPRAPGHHHLAAVPLHQRRADNRVACQASAPLLLLSPPSMVRASWPESQGTRASSLAQGCPLGPGGAQASRRCRSEAAVCSRPRHRRRCHRPASPPRVTPPGLLLDLGLQLHMLAILLLSAHFRKIVRGIDKMINGEPEPGERSSSNVPWDIVFMVAIVGLILLGSIVAILSGLFSLGDIFTVLLISLWVIVLVGLGLWFRHYAKKVISLTRTRTLTLALAL